MKLVGVWMSLEGKVALVTGGSRGIGAATVRLFREAGAKVVFSYREAAGAASALVEECGGEGECRAVRQELATPEDGRALVMAALEAFGRLDCLVVNHGIWPAHEQPVATMLDTQWARTLGVNLHSVFGVVQAGVVAMFENDAPVKGHVVLIASTAAQRGEAFHADYAASKGAVVSLTKSLSSELAPLGIYVNCVAPGWVGTAMSAAALSDPATSKRAVAGIPLGRVGTVEEIAGPVLFLCTPWAGFMSGEIVNVNGGAVLVG